MRSDPLRVLVLGGGPDRECEVSHRSAANVAAALTAAGHQVIRRDIQPTDLSPLDAFEKWGGEVVFPVLHGRWGEGGPLQRILEHRRLRFVGCGEAAAALCIDKAATKHRLREHGLPTPESEVLARGEAPTLGPPAVVKAVDEGSSLGLYLCRSAEAMHRAAAELLERYDRVLVERLVDGAEVTVGVLEAEAHGFQSVGVVGVVGVGGVALQPLPPIWIQPATTFYDYEAKYTRDDTRYRFDLPAAWGPEAGKCLRDMAVTAHRALGCRHLSRVDFIVDETGRPWVLEVNTMPGFTSHSLLPMAAREAGLDLPEVASRLVHLAAHEQSHPTPRPG